METKQALVIFSTKEEFKELINKCLDSKLEQLQKTTSNKNTQNSSLSAQEAANFLNIKLSTLYSLVSRKEITHYKKCGKLYFFSNELLDWIRSNPRSSVAAQARQSDALFLSANRRRRKPFL